MRGHKMCEVIPAFIIFSRAIGFHYINIGGAFQHNQANYLGKAGDSISYADSVGQALSQNVNHAFSMKHHRIHHYNVYLFFIFFQDCNVQVITGTNDHHAKPIGLIGHCMMERVNTYLHNSPTVERMALLVNERHSDDRLYFACHNLPRGSCIGSRQAQTDRTGTDRTERDILIGSYNAITVRQLYANASSRV